MAEKTVTPSLGAESFSCPYPGCGAISHQTWHRVYLKKFERYKPPRLPVPNVIENIKSSSELENKDVLIRHFELMLAKELALDTSFEIYTSLLLDSLYVNRCYSCDRYALWISDSLIYPASPPEVEPHEDMPKEIQKDFLEAASIIDQSPRGAAALLRLCIQKLMAHLKLKGKNIDEDIGELVKQGLDDRIRKALDLVRVIGNNAVHPGQIDLTDDKKTAMELFGLVNIIVQDRISTQKRIDEMYGKLPPGAREAIEKRDGKKEEEETKS